MSIITMLGKRMATKNYKSCKQISGDDSQLQVLDALDAVHLVTPAGQHRCWVAQHACSTAEHRACNRAVYTAVAHLFRFQMGTANPSLCCLQ